MNTLFEQNEEVRELLREIILICNKNSLGSVINATLVLMVSAMHADEAEFSEMLAAITNAWNSPITHELAEIFKNSIVKEKLS